MTEELPWPLTGHVKQGSIRVYQNRIVVIKDIENGIATFHFGNDSDIHTASISELQLPNPIRANWLMGYHNYWMKQWMLE